MFALKFQNASNKANCDMFWHPTFIKNITTNAKTTCVIFGHPKSKLGVA
jgi:hypothetical protein